MKYKILILLLHATATAQTDYEIQKKKEEIKQLSLFNRILNSIDIKIHAGFGAGYFLSQYDPINPVYQPYAVRDRFSVSITLNISKILDNSALKIKQIELKQLEQKELKERREREIKNQKLKEQINLLNEQIKTQEKIAELYQLFFNQNKIQIDKLLEQKMKLLELKTKLKQLELELTN